MEKIIKMNSDTYVFANRDNEYLTGNFTTKKEAIWLLNENLRSKYISFSKYKNCILILQKNITIPEFSHSPSKKTKEEYEYQKMLDVVDNILVAGYLLNKETSQPIFPIISCIIKKNDKRERRKIYYLVYGPYEIKISCMREHFIEFNSKIINSIGESLLLIQEFKSDTATYHRLVREISDLRFTHQEN